MIYTEMQMIKDKLYDPKRIHRHKWKKRSTFNLQ